MVRIVLILLAVAAAAGAYGLDPSGFNLVGGQGYGSSFSPEFSSLASFSFSSGRSGSYGRGTYLGSMLFSLHPRVDATVELGYSRLLNFSGDGTQVGSVLGGFQLDWRPSDSTIFSVVYRGVLPEENLNLGGF